MDYERNELYEKREGGCLMSYADKARKIIEDMRRKKDGYERNEKNEISALPLPLPFMNQYDELVIPFTSDPRFHYWHGGQSIAQTEKELRWKH